jgi:hypothetical protein
LASSRTKAEVRRQFAAKRFYSIERLLSPGVATNSELTRARDLDLDIITLPEAE